jgi:hypothetical protein
VIAVKDNQPTLRQDIEATFAEAADGRTRSVDETPRPQVEVFEETDKGHGRVEKRTVLASPTRESEQAGIATTSSSY